jgi:hypothetical protein
MSGLVVGGGAEEDSVVWRRKSSSVFVAAFVVRLACVVIVVMTTGGFRRGKHVFGPAQYAAYDPLTIGQHEAAFDIAAHAVGEAMLPLPFASTLSSNLLSTSLQLQIRRLGQHPWTSARPENSRLR